MSDYEEVPVVAMDPPELDDVQSGRHYLMVIPEFKQFKLEPLTASNLLEITKMNDGLSQKVKNAVYRFLSSAKPGSHLWVGHMLPLVFCLVDEDQTPDPALLVPKALGKV